MANIRTNILKTNIIAPLLAPHPVHQTAPFSGRDGRTSCTQHPPLPHPPGAHLREGRKVTSTGYSPLLIQIRSPIPERSSIDSVSQTSLPHDGSQQTRVGKCLAAHQAAPTQKATSRRAKTRGLALSKIIPNFAEQKGQLRPPKPQAGL